MNYTCIHPTESITILILQVFTLTQRLMPFFSMTCLDEVDNLCMIQSHRVLWESLRVIFPTVEATIQAMTISQAVHTSEQRGHLGFLLLSDTATGIAVMLLGG